MIQSDETDLQHRIQMNVTNGVGYFPLKYLDDKHPYKDFLTEDEVKNTSAGLKFNLAVMNMDRELAKYFELEKRKFLGKFRAGIYYLGLQLKHQNLRDNAINEAVENKCGLKKILLKDYKDSLIENNVLNYILFSGNND